MLNCLSLLLALASHSRCVIPCARNILYARFSGLNSPPAARPARRARLISSSTASMRILLFPASARTARARRSLYLDFTSASLIVNAVRSGVLIHLLFCTLNCPRLTNGSVAFCTYNSTSIPRILILCISLY